MKQFVISPVRQQSVTELFQRKTENEFRQTTMNNIRRRLAFLSFWLCDTCANTHLTRKHRQSYRHADPRRRWPQVAQRRIGLRHSGHGHYSNRATVTVFVTVYRVTLTFDL